VLETASEPGYPNAGYLARWPRPRGDLTFYVRRIIRTSPTSTGAWALRRSRWWLALAYMVLHDTRRFGGILDPYLNGLS